MESEQGARRKEGEGARLTPWASLPTVLQPFRQPRAIDQTGARTRPPDGEEDGRNARALVPLLDRSPIPRQGGRNPHEMSNGAQVDLRHGILSREE